MCSSFMSDSSDGLQCVRTHIVSQLRAHAQGFATVR
jgi:hypothetical protein